MAAIITIPRYFNPALVLAFGSSSINVIAFRNGEGLQVEFTVTRTLTNTPDTCTVRASGVDPIRAELMGAQFRTTGKMRMTLRAGYDAITGGVFAGDVRRFVSQRRSGADLWTEADADDGGEGYTSVVLRISNAQMTAENMIDVAAAAMGLIVPPQTYAIIRATDVGKQGPYTAVMTAAAHELIDAACRRLRCRWWIRDSQLFLTRLGLPDTSRPAVLVTSQTLVGEVSHGGLGIVSLPCMFDPNIVQGGQVSFEGTFFRVEKVVHAGATRGTLWTSTIEGRAL